MAVLSALRLIVTGCLLLTSMAFLRLLYVLPPNRRARRDPRTKYSKTKPSHLVIVLGSGGHSGEMISLLRDVDPTRYTQRTYISSSGDKFAKDKAYEIEKTIQGKHCSLSHTTSLAGESNSLTGCWDLKVVPRARKIHQSLITTPVSSLKCLRRCIAILVQTSEKSFPPQYPDVIITNGPATAVMVILASVILKFLGVAPIWKMKIIYVESFARVKTLSLSGKVLLHMGVCDKFLVQWEELAKSINGNKASNRVEWKGFLVG